jgi:hypothetical protein
MGSVPVKSCLTGDVGSRNGKRMLLAHSLVTFQPASCQTRPPALIVLGLETTRVPLGQKTIDFCPRGCYTDLRLRLCAFVGRVVAALLFWVACCCHQPGGLGPQPSRGLMKEGSRSVCEPRAAVFFHSPAASASCLWLRRLG